MLDDLEAGVKLPTGAEFRCLLGPYRLWVAPSSLSSGYQCHVGQSGRMVKLAINLHLLTKSCNSMEYVVSTPTHAVETAIPRNIFKKANVQDSEVPIQEDIHPV